jgi:hypothetical protein
MPFFDPPASRTYQSFLFEELSISSIYPFLGKKQKEIRKREQATSLLPSLTSFATFFDTLSFESFALLQESLAWSKELRERTLSTDILALVFLGATIRSKNLKRLIQKKLSESQKKLKGKPFQDFPLNKLANRVFQSVSAWIRKNSFVSFFPKESSKTSFGKETLKKKENFSFSTNSRYFSIKVLEVFEKALFLAETEFGTPMISPEIFLLALADTSSLSTQALFRQLFPTSARWFAFRFYLIKKIYKQELFLKEKFFKPQRLYFYILRKGVSFQNLEKILSFFSTDELDEFFFRVRRRLYKPLFLWKPRVEIQEHFFLHLKKKYEEKKMAHFREKTQAKRKRRSFPFFSEKNESS